MRKFYRRGMRITVAAAAAGTMAVAAGALASSAQAAPLGHATSYHFATLDNKHDLTFNQLLGINNEGVIAGYFGSGAAGHPNQGYLLSPRYGHPHYRGENFPGSVQTQVTGLNDQGVTVGFWSSMNNVNQVNDNFGFWERNGKFHVADFPTGDAATPPVDQLLGVNDHGVAVGFYTDAAGTNHGYTVNTRSGHYHLVTDPHAPTASLTAAAINNEGDIAGFYTNPANGVTDGFLKDGHHFTDLAMPGASATNAFGLNDRGEVVGTYTVGTGSSAVTHGFTWTARHGFNTVDDPHGVGTTTVNGVNNAGDLVGFYTDGAGNVDGMLATPQR